jgi:hypothetical protein
VTRGSRLVADFLTGDGERDESTDERPFIRRVAGILRLLLVVGVDVDDDVDGSRTFCLFEAFGPLSVLSFRPRSFGVTGDRDRLLLLAFFGFVLLLVFSFSISLALRRAAKSMRKNTVLGFSL